MKFVKKLALLLSILLISILFIPTTAHALVTYNVTVTVSPSTLGELGGDAQVKVIIENTGSEGIQQVDMDLTLPSGVIIMDKNDLIAVGASKTYTYTVAFQSGDLNQNLTFSCWAEGALGAWVQEIRTVKVTGEDNIIRSGDEIVPDKNIYYVGETVSITDTMRNSLGLNVTNLKMEYYLRRSTGDTAGDAVNIGTLTPNEKKSNTLDYTFTDKDLDGLRIGSKVTYYVSGKGPYTEYNVAHDFTVHPSATPTTSPTPTASPTPEPTVQPTDTPAPEQNNNENASVTNNNNDSDNKSEDNNYKSDDTAKDESILGDKTIILTIIIAAGVIVVFVMILIIVLVAKKK